MRVCKTKVALIIGANFRNARYLFCL